MNGSTWTSIGATCNGSTGAIVLYIDGVAVDTDTATASYVANAGNQSENLYFSSIPAWASAANHYDGAVDNIRLYNTVLTANQMMALHLYPAEQGGGKISANILSAGMLQSSNYNGSSAGLAFDLDNAELKVYESEGIVIETGGGMTIKGDDSTPATLKFQFGTDYATIGGHVTNKYLSILPSSNGIGGLFLGDNTKIWNSIYLESTYLYIVSLSGSGGTAMIGELDLEPGEFNLYAYKAAYGYNVGITADGQYNQVNIKTAANGKLFLDNIDRIQIETSKTPASASATGTAGEICWDASYLYVCTASTPTWTRIPLSPWTSFTSLTDITISPSSGAPKLSLIRQISGSPNQWDLYVGPSDEFVIQESDATRLTIDTSGNVTATGTLYLPNYLYIESAAPGVWMEEGTDKGVLMVLDGQVLQFQKRATAFGAYESILLSVGIDGILRINTKTPSSASDTGTAGMICWDSGALYVCVAANTWKKVAIATW
jgi:hypothetical protein